MKIHPNPESVRKLFEGLHPQVRRQLEHVMGCSRCRRVFVDLARSVPAEGAGNVLSWREEPPASEVPILMASERAAEDWTVGAGRTFGEVDLELWLGRKDVSPLEAWTLAERLLEGSRNERQEDTGKAERLALAAVRLAEHLGCGQSRPLLAWDLQALAWTYVGAARRLSGDLRGAEEALNRSEVCLDRGSGDLLERAVLMETFGALRKDQRRFGEAEELLTRAAHLFQTLGDREAAARSLLNVANVFRERGDVARAIGTLERVANQAGAEVTSGLLLVIRHNLALYLADAGRFDDAEELLKASDPLYRQSTDEFSQVRRRWLEAKISRGHGLFEEAERGFLEVRESFVRNGIGYDAALVSLELATLYAEQQRFSAMRRLADEMLPIFRAQDIHREALAALAVFQQAARMETVTLKLAREIAEYLDEARFHPDLRFEVS